MYVIESVKRTSDGGLRVTLVTRQDIVLPATKVTEIVDGKHKLKKTQQLLAAINRAVKTDGK